MTTNEEIIVEPDLIEFFINSVGQSTSVGACSLLQDISKFHNGSLEDPNIGDTVFNNSSGTSTFNGNDLWYSSITGFAIRINTSGVVTDIELCGFSNGGGSGNGFEQ